MRAALPFVLLLFIFPSLILAQQKDISSMAGQGDSAITNYSAFKRALSFAGLLQVRYVGSLTRNVDINGVNFDPNAPVKGITNSFFVRRARLQVHGYVNDHFSGHFMMNFAEFSGNPSNRVLENAYIKYTLNRHFNVQAGQFRPFIGIEDALPVDIIRTLDYSNQYTAFGANGWQSFQIGVSVFGTITKEDAMQWRYYAGAYNGNNRNQAIDNDNTKNFYARLEADPSKRLTLGVNAASGSQGSGTGYAFGGDAVGRIDLSTKWKILLSAEYKSGTNFTAYNSSSATPRPPLDQYRMQGFYFFPVLRYEYAHPRVRAVELSSRYEWFDEDTELNSNPRQTIIPNLSFIFADNFYAVLQAGVSIDLYKNEIPLTKYYSHNMAYLQLQVRF